MPFWRRGELTFRYEFTFYSQVSGSNSPQPSKNLRATSPAVLPQETAQSIQSLQPENSQSFTNSLERCWFSFGNPRK